MKKLVLIAFLVAAPLAIAQKTSDLPNGLDSLTDLSRLPLLPANVWFHSISSQDVTGETTMVSTELSIISTWKMADWVLLDTRGAGCVTLFRVIHHDRWNGTLWIRTRKGGAENTDSLPLPGLVQRQARAVSCPAGGRRG